MNKFFFLKSLDGKYYLVQRNIMIENVIEKNSFLDRYI